MRYYEIDESKSPVRAIDIFGTRIMEVDLNKGWEIAAVIFADGVPANEIDYLVVQFEKKRREGEQE